MWDALADPFHDQVRPWFDIGPGERAPTVLDGQRPTSISWSSIWTDWPDLEVHFEIAPDGAGSMVRLSLHGSATMDPEEIERCRYRLSQLINGRLRDSFDA